MAFRYPEIKKEEYTGASPFPSIVLKDVWEPELLNQCEKEVLSFKDWDGEKQFFGAQSKTWCSVYEKLPASVQKVISEASQPKFLKWLEDLTGETALMPDPYLFGGGIHSIGQGGFLKVHSDFNWHPKLKLFRRLNVLIYLNDNWPEEYGGELELWNKNLSHCDVHVRPVKNTMVIFTTDDKSYHGHPKPLTCPPDRRRNSIALYYYSPVRPKRNFLFKRNNTDYQPVTGDHFKGDSRFTYFYREVRMSLGKFFGKP